MQVVISRLEIYRQDLAWQRDSGQITNRLQLCARRRGMMAVETWYVKLCNACWSQGCLE